jgi:hypothetical protein
MAAALANQKEEPMNQHSTLRRTAREAIRAKHPHAHQKYVPTQPARRTQPLRMTQWKYLWREELVELRRGDRVTAQGWVDDLTPDGTIIWIFLTDGMGRAMIHHNDGIDIWRVDSRILQDRNNLQPEPTERRRGETPTFKAHPLPEQDHR